MGLKEYVNDATNEDLNGEVSLIKFDFWENRNQAISTYNYCAKDIKRMYKLYVDMGNTGHYVFDDAIRFKIIKMTECFKYLSMIMRFKFYAHISNRDDAINTMNSDILTNTQVERLNELLDDRNESAHERNAYECYMFEQEMQNIKNDVNDLTDIFTAFISEYESNMGITFTDTGWFNQNN